MDKFVQSEPRWDRSHSGEIEAIFDAAIEGIIFANRQGMIERMNAAALGMFGWEEGELVGLNVSVLMPDSEGQDHDQHIDRYVAGKGAKVLGRGRQLWGRRKNGEEFPIFVSLASVDSPQHQGFVAVCRDVTDEAKRQERIFKLAYYCRVTGLPNREKLLLHLQSMVKSLEKDETHFSIIEVSLSNFWIINNVFGRTFGDEALVETSRRIQEEANRFDGFVATLGGDDFAIVIEDKPTYESADQLARACLDALSVPFQVQSTNVHIAANAGVIRVPRDGTVSADLLTKLQNATLHARVRGTGEVSYYSDDVRKDVAHIHQLESKLREDMRSFQGFSISYQPKHDFRTGQLVGAEALLRWTNAEFGPVSPATFVPIAERTGLIAPLGEWVLDQAFAHSAELCSLAEGNFQVAINLSPRQLVGHGINAYVFKLLEKYDLDPSAIQFELTESGLVENQDKAIEDMHRLRSQGFTFAVDDFGTGFSSLSYLKRFPLDYLKIDKSFVDGIPGASEDCELAKCIYGVAQALGFGVVAEGVEDQAQFDFLKDVGCDVCQGYFYSPPLSIEELVNYIERS